MKKFIAALSLTMASMQAHATGLLMVGGGQEKLGTLTVDLYQVGVGKRFDNGVSVGGSAMIGYPNRAGLPKETRPELSVGYDTQIGKVAPYTILSVGQRQVKGRNNVDYYSVRVGSRYRLTQQVYTDVYYRYRDTNDAIWKSHLYSAGIGYAVTKSTALQLNYGYTNGDYSSRQTSIFVINRF